eukprot:TRINITY_DN18609_c0_g1_i1.p1 TRINITY_DN18609_c0_g1~~TRINITY_DN18609_c0_g1_i1.p1  ORF type:complete len:114 (-),score=14.67 TRINITY_DN18609_c0_g1_i1:38-379(-)
MLGNQMSWDHLQDAYIIEMAFLSFGTCIDFTFCFSLYFHSLSFPFFLLCVLFSEIFSMSKRLKGRFDLVFFFFFFYFFLPFSVTFFTRDLSLFFSQKKCLTLSSHYFAMNSFT